MTNAGACTVGFLKAMEVPSLDNACGSFTLALAGNVNLVAGGEYVRLNEVAYAVSVCVSETELFKSLFGSYARLVEKALHGFCHLIGL